MDDMTIVGTYDVAELVFYAFVLFFSVSWFICDAKIAGRLPLEDEVTGRVDTPGGDAFRCIPQKLSHALRSRHRNDTYQGSRKG
jgi:hypothetical protein